MRKTILLSIVLLLSLFSPRLLHAACTTPTVVISNITINSFSAGWTGVPTALNFEYILDQSPATPVVPGTPTTNNTQAFTGLLPSTTYYLHVRANCGVANGFSAWVNNPVTTLSLPPCGPPPGLIAYGFTNFSANIVWAAVPGALSYQFLLNQNPATPIVQGIPTALTYYNATGLAPGTTYYFHLRTDCSAYPGDTSGWETIQFATPPIPPCQAATGFTANNITNNSADVAWSPQSNILGWEFVLDQNPSDPVVGALTTANALAFTGLTSLTTYYLHLRTDCSVYPNDSSHWVHFSFMTHSDSCTLPSGQQITFVSPFTAFVSWNASPGAYGYEYLIDQNPGTPAEGGTPTFSTFHSVTGLLSSTTYYLHIRTVCDTGIYNNSYTDWVTTSFYTQPGLKASNVAGSDNFIIAAFPNPVQQAVAISIQGIQQGNSTLQLTDMTGKLLQTVAVGGKDKLTINMNDFAAGIYLLRYTDNEQVYTLKLVKQ